MAHLDSITYQSSFLDGTVPTFEAMFGNRTTDVARFCHISSSRCRAIRIGWPPVVPCRRC
jgi:phosphatidate phosphatase PAH1